MNREAIRQNAANIQTEKNYILLIICYYGKTLTSVVISYIKLANSTEAVEIPLLHPPATISSLVVGRVTAKQS